MRETKRKLLELLIDAKRDGRWSSATERLARATRCSTTAAFAATSSISPSIGIPTSTAAISRERTSRSSRPRRSTRSARPHLILPWNFKDEILAQMDHARDWGARFIVPIPEATVI